MELIPVSNNQQINKKIYFHKNQFTSFNMAKVIKNIYKYIDLDKLIQFTFVNLFKRFKLFIF